MLGLKTQGCTRLGQMPCDQGGGQPAWAHLVRPCAPEEAGEGVAHRKAGLVEVVGQVEEQGGNLESSLVQHSLLNV